MKSLYKIVHTSAGTRWQDTERRIFSEAVWMQDQGHQMVVIAPRGSPLFTRSKEAGIQVYPLSFRGLTLRGQLRELTEILANEQPNILNAHGKTDGRISLKAAQKAGVPCRIISHHDGSRLSSSWQNKTLYKKQSHYVFTASDQARQQAKETLKLKDMEVFSIPDGIAQPPDFRSRTEARHQMADLLDLDPGTLFLGLLEACDSRHDIAAALRLIKAFRQIRMEIPHHLLIPVTKEFESHLAGTIEKKTLGERVCLIPADDTWDYFRALSCGIICPSPEKRHGTPRALLKAMFASCPVAGSRTEGIMQLITHRETGLLFEDQDINQLADVLLEALTHEAAAKERVHSAREKVKQEFSIETMGRDLIRIYRLHQVRLERRYHQVDPELY